VAPPVRPVGPHVCPRFAGAAVLQRSHRRVRPERAVRGGAHRRGGRRGRAGVLRVRAAVETAQSDGEYTY
jgi:hypothetical protein